MGGDSQESTTTSNPWSPAVSHITSGMDWAQQIVMNQANNVPQMGQVGMNSNLQNAWNNMAGSGLSDLAGVMGQAGAGMLEGYDPSKVQGAYEELAKGPNMYNQQNYRDTMLADRKGYLEDANSATMAQLEKATAQATGQIYGQAAGGGNVGSSRTQLASGQSAGNLAAGAQSTMANLYNNAFDTASQQAAAQEQARLQGVGQYAAGQQGMLQAGMGALGSAGNMYQQSMNNQLQAGAGQMSFEQQQELIKYQNAMNAWQAPQNLVGWYSGIAQGAGGLGGTSTSVQPVDRVGQMMGIAGSAAMMMSDKRLKDNIKQVTYDFSLDLPIYEWDWNEEAEELFEEFPELKGPNYGVIAQEVQNIYPEAVKEHGEYLTVDYSKLIEIGSKLKEAPVFADGKWLTREQKEESLYSDEGGE